MKPDRQFAALLLCFALSGFAALLYQTAWLREFSFLFGTAELAVVSVLAAYMGGLAGGAAIAGRFANRIRRPILVYGILELGIALCALAVPAAIRGATDIYVFLLGSRPAPTDEGQLTGILFFVVCSFVILALPTGLMGVTLPLLARHAVRRADEIGRRIGALYAINTAGAVAGTLCAAFVLLPRVGLRQTVYIGALANALVFFAATLVARRADPVVDAMQASRPDGRLAGLAGAPDGPVPENRWILPLIAISGAISFSFEVLWTRLLGQILGGSIYAFATMLASFLLGITLGSALASRWATTRRGSALGFAGVQLCIAVASLAAYSLLDWLPALARAIGASSHASLGPNATVAAVFLFPAASFIGATFPFAVRILARDETEAATASARVYAWNTCGAIIGALGTGLFLLPSLGFAGLIFAATGTNLLLALGTALLARPAPRVLVAAAVALLIGLVSFPPSSPWRVLRTNPSVGAAAQGDVTYFGIGRSATVLLLDTGTGWALSTNGLRESEIQPPGTRPGSALTTRWLGQLPILARPEARSALLVGLGGALTLQAIPSSVGEIDVIELEPEVVAANRAVASLRDSDPLADPRVNVIVNDARGALMLTNRRYDAIISQPSHPWTAGASHLYTREFFSLVRAHLNSGGVFSQWIGLRFVDEELLKILVATLLDTFPNVRLYQPVAASVVFLASDTPLSLEVSAEAALAATPEDFARFGFRSVEDVAASLVLDERGAREFARDAAVNTDRNNLLASRSPRLTDESSLVRAGGNSLFSPFDPLPALAQDLDSVYLVRRMIQTSGVTRAAGVVAALSDPATKAAGQGWLEIGTRRLALARIEFERALALNPNSIEAACGLLLIDINRGLHGAGGSTADAPAACEGGSSVSLGTSALAKRDFAELRSLEDGLAAIPAQHPLFHHATRLRVHWRLAERNPELSREALEIVNQITILSPWAWDNLLRGRVALSAGYPVAAIASVQEILPSAQDRVLANAAVALLEEIPDGVLDNTVMSLLARFRR